MRPLKSPVYRRKERQHLFQFDCQLLQGLFLCSQSYTYHNSISDLSRLHDIHDSMGHLGGNELCVASCHRSVDFARQKGRDHGSSEIWKDTSKPDQLRIEWTVSPTECTGNRKLSFVSGLSRTWMIVFRAKTEVFSFNGQTYKLPFHLRRRNKLVTCSLRVGGARLIRDGFRVRSSRSLDDCCRPFLSQKS